MYIGFLFVFSLIVSVFGETANDWWGKTKNEQLADIKKWNEAFPKTSEFDYAYLMHDGHAVLTLYQSYCCGVKTVNEWLEQIKKNNETLYEKAKELYERQLKSYNELPEGKAKDLAKMDWSTAWSHMPELQKLGVARLGEIKKTLQTDNVRWMEKAKELSADDWLLLIEAFPLSANQAREFLPPKALKRLVDAKIPIGFK